MTEDKIIDLLVINSEDNWDEKSLKSLWLKNYRKM